MSLSPSLTRLAVPVFDSRVLLGRDFGSQARVVAIAGLVRLVWAKPTCTLLRNPGMVRAEQGATLELRVFKRVSDGSLAFSYSTELFVGGRLSKSRLAQHRAAIDAALGEGATAQLDVKSTAIFGTDMVGEFLELLAPRRPIEAAARTAPRESRRPRAGAIRRRNQASRGDFPLPASLPFRVSDVLHAGKTPG